MLVDMQQHFRLTLKVGSYIQFTTGQVVQEYDTSGPTNRLPDLNHGRENNACGHYVNSNNKIVGTRRKMEK